MLALVTGVAGFIGSNLAERLIGDGWNVRGVDRFTAYYEETLKRSNLTGLSASAGFELVEADLLTAELGPMLDGVDVVFHQAAQPGVRLSWADGFRLYNDLNVNLTQRLLEAVRHRNIERFVYASSSSVYGQAPRWPTAETDETRPHSPYGVTKLAGELLCGAYAANFDVPTVALRYFTVYGPRQRPDMAIHRLIEAARNGTPFPLYGDGEQVRDFTFVSDVVQANLSAALCPLVPGTVMNIAGGGSTRLLDLVDLVAKEVGTAVPVNWLPAQPGDVLRTGGAIERARASMGWFPEVGVAEGVRRQVAWHLEAHGAR
jgi:nucleoside-diphosphate-sugar epimerase